MPSSQGAAYNRAAKALNQLGVHGLSPTHAALASLALASQPGLKRFRARLIQHLQRLANTPGFFRQGLYTTLPVITALYANDKLGVGGKHLAALIKQLIAHELQAGGPYAIQGEPGVYLNALVAAFARLTAKPLPKVEAFLQSHVKASHLATPGSPITLGFLLHYTGHAQSSPLPRTAQLPNGLWQGDPDCPGALATAIQLYYSRLHANTTATANGRRSKQVATLAKKLFAQQAGPIAAQLQRQANAAIKADHHFEITLLAYFFSRPFKPPAHQWQLMGAASLCGWVAYSLYDNLMDGDAHVSCIPLANIAQRQCLALFWQAQPSTSFKTFAMRLLDTMDTANAWELANCRFTVRGQIITVGQLPRFGRGSVLAERGIGHALAPIAAIWQHTSHAARRSAERGFRHYIIARQLADDLHDWQKDLQAGHISYVVAAILREHGVAPGPHHLPTLHAALQGTFITTTLPKVCAKVLRHVEQSKVAFGTLPFNTPKEMLALLDRLATMARQSAKAGQNNAAFAREFQRSGNDRVVKVKY